MNLLLLIFFQFMTPKHLKFKVQKLEASSLVRIDEYIV